MAYGNGITSGSLAAAAPPMGYAGADAISIQPQSERIHKEIESALSRVHNAIAHVRAFADMQQGERGEKAQSGGKDQPHRSGRMGAIADVVDSLHGALHTLESELARLNEI